MASVRPGHSTRPPDAKSLLPPKPPQLAAAMPASNSRTLLYLYTRTPLHVGSGADLGAIDQPVARERATGFPIVPASALKGAFADWWTSIVPRPPTSEEKEAAPDVQHYTGERDAEGRWLLGSTDPMNPARGALIFTEARLLAFPVRSARGGWAWLTSPLMLQRFARDQGIDHALVPSPEPLDNQAHFTKEKPLGKVSLETKGERGAVSHVVVLEDYTFQHTKELPTAAVGGKATTLASALEALFPNDEVWRDIAGRLVVVSNGMMSFFATHACDVATHVRIDDTTGAAATGGLYTQENVPSETLFYTLINAAGESAAEKKPGEVRREAAAALTTFNTKLRASSILQIGGDATTGCGYLSVRVSCDPSTPIGQGGGQ